MSRGLTLWFTGLPRAGKTTIAGLVAAELRRRGQAVEVLDGDVMRKALSAGLGFSKQDRDTNVRRIAFVADLLSRNGVIAITAAISPYREVRDEARALMQDRFIEVYLKASVETCAARDSKGVYAKAFEGEIKDFTGVSDPYESPLDPELLLDTESQGPEQSAAAVLDYLERRGMVPEPTAVARTKGLMASAARRSSALLGPEARFMARTEARVLRSRGPVFAARRQAMVASAWMRDRLNRRRYELVDEERLRGARRSDTVFVFGSGSSLNELTAAEWDTIQEHDVFGFNNFFRQDWLPVDFHLFRTGVLESLRQRPYAELAGRSVAESPHYADTIFLLQEGYLAEFSNHLVGYRALPVGARVFRYRTARFDGPPSRSLSNGLRHIVGTLDDVVNAAYAIGWQEIVLVGVDMYDSRYFWLPPNKTATSDPATGELIVADRNTYRGQRADELHSTARHGAVELMARWAEHMAADGVRLSVYNPRSLLAEVLPVYSLPARV